MSGGILRYPGGKTRAVKLLLSLIPDPEEPKIVSPFFGGGSVEIALANRGSEVIGYDVFKPLTDFWSVLLSDRKDFMIDYIYNIIGSEFTKKKFNKSRQFIKESFDGDAEPEEIGAHYYCLNRSSFSGTTMSGGYSAAAASGRLNENAILRLKNFKVEGLTVLNESFEQSIPRHHDAFLFLDPPYYSAKKLYGISGELQTIDHFLLFKMLRKRDRWILCYDNCPEIRKMYKNYYIYDVNWAYGMNKTKKSKEIIISPIKLKIKSIKGSEYRRP